LGTPVVHPHLTGPEKKRRFKPTVAIFKFYCVNGWVAPGADKREYTLGYVFAYV